MLWIFRRRITSSGVVFAAMPRFRAEALHAFKMVVCGTPVSGLTTFTFGGVLCTGNSERSCYWL